MTLPRTLFISTLALTLIGSSTNPTRAQAQDLPILTVAFMGPLSGPLSGMGGEIRATSALSLVSARLKFRKLGFDLRFKTLDDMGSPEVGANLARALVQDKNIIALVGPGLSGVALPVTEILAKSNVAVLTATSLSSITSRGLNNTFRVIASDVSSARAASEYLSQSLNVRSVLVVDDGATYGLGMSKVISGQLETRAIGVSGRLSLGTSSVDAVLEALKTQKPDAVYFAGSFDKAATLVKRMRSERLDTLFFGGELLSFPGFLSAAGGAAAGVLYTSPTAPAAGYPAAAGFLARYRKLQKQDASGVGILGHDATGALLEALRSAIAKNGGKTPTRLEVLQAVSRVKYPGFSGSVEFDDTGERRSSTVFVLRVQTDGTLRVAGSLSVR